MTGKSEVSSRGARARKPLRSAIPSPSLEQAAARGGGANATADRAIDILLLFSLDRPVWTTAQIAEHFGMPRSTTHRYISSLRTYALLVEDEGGGWHLGPRLFPLARAARAANSIVTVAAPFLQDLNDTFGEAITLYERIGVETIPLERYETHHRVKLLYSRGHILPWPGAASAKVLLAFAPSPLREEMLAQMSPVRFTARTIRTEKELRAALARIVRDGFAYSDQERDEGIRAIAAPIFSRGDGRYCVTMSGPSFRMTDDRIAVMTAKVVSVAADITAAMARTEY